LYPKSRDACFYAAQAARQGEAETAYKKIMTVLIIIPTAHILMINDIKE